MEHDSIRTLIYTAATIGPGICENFTTAVLSYITFRFAMGIVLKDMYCEDIDARVLTGKLPRGCVIMGSYVGDGCRKLYRAILLTIYWIHNCKR